MKAISSKLIRDEKRAIPEFPYAILVFVIAIGSLIVFYRLNCVRTWP